MIHSYGKVWPIGHRATKELFSGPVEIQEKIDGSQFSMRWDGTELFCKSRNKMLEDPPQKMFTQAMETAKALDLREGWTYRGEYLQKPNHNSLCYDRIPEKHIIIFDIDAGQEDYLGRWEREDECVRLGLEPVPVLDTVEVKTTDQLLSYLDAVSVLGGAKIEGVVCKNYSKLGEDGYSLKGKFVSEQFKEIHGKEWKRKNPGQADIKRRIGETYQTEARWLKAIQHLEENGKLDGSPKDIGPLIKEVCSDVYLECAEDIKDELFKWAWKDISRMLTHGLPDWYKRRLMERVLD
jgi:hypothetical protein